MTKKEHHWRVPKRRSSGVSWHRPCYAKVVVRGARGRFVPADCDICGDPIEKGDRVHWGGTARRPLQLAHDTCRAAVVADHEAQSKPNLFENRYSTETEPFGAKGLRVLEQMCRAEAWVPDALLGRP